MKKSSFITMILGTISVLCLGIGMCMSLLPTWNMFDQGIIVGVIGLVMALITVLVYRKMEHKEPLHFILKTVMIIIVMIIGLLCLGAGMSLTMVFGNIILGIVVGIVGIILLLCLFPLCMGFK